MTASKPRCWALPARCLHRRPTPSRHPTRMSPLFLCIPFDAAERVGFQPAAEPRDFKCHPNGLHVLRALCACPASSLHSWVLPARCLRRRRSSTPSRHRARMSRLFRCFPFDSAVRVGVQPAAEPRHVQRHEHAIHVSGALRACPASSLHSWALPARCLRRCRPTPSCLAARASPSSFASLSTRQYASSFSQPLSFDTSSVTNMDSMFYVRCARALHVAHAAATPRHPVSWPRTLPSSYAFLST